MVSPSIHKMRLVLLCCAALSLASLQVNAMQVLASSTSDNKYHMLSGGTRGEIPAVQQRLARHPRGAPAIDVGLAPGERLPDLAPDILDILIIRGRLGDSLRQLSWALLYAEINSFTAVAVRRQSYDKHFREFLSIPPGDEAATYFPIHVNPLPEGASPHLMCERGATVWDVHSTQPAFQCIGISPSDERRVMLNYIKPLVIRSRPVAGVADDELVIHLRSGDAMTTQESFTMFESTMPPCAFYQGILSGSAQHFKRVRIVTEQDRSHPCISELKSHFTDRVIDVQSESLQEDAATLMNAHYLVLSQSYFSHVLSMLNSEVQVLWKMASYEAAELVPRDIDGVQVIDVKVPDVIGVFPTYEERIDWMKAYSVDKIVQANPDLPRVVVGNR